MARVLEVTKTVLTAPFYCAVKIAPVVLYLLASEIQIG